MNKHTIEIINLATHITSYMAPTNNVNLLGNKILREIHWLMNHRKGTDLYEGAVANILESLGYMIKEARTNVCQTATLVPLAEKKLNNYKQKYRLFEVGMEVKLKKGTVHNCPAGRENNKTAKISCFMEDYSEGALRVDRDLKGCTYWNVEDLEICSFEEKSCG